jgi:ketosteroid isomerase-like protein
LFHAVEAGDIEAVAACYADDIVIWHNYDGVEQSGADNLRVLEWVIAKLADRRYEVVRRIAVDDGFVQQHVLHGRVSRNGAELHVPACMVCTVRDGKITRIDEYLDITQLAPLFDI